jgi:hypothetical protein
MKNRWGIFLIIIGIATIFLDLLLYSVFGMYGIIGIGFILIGIYGLLTS